MSESPNDMLARLRLMRDGNPTWDLSDNDRDALNWILDEHERAKERLDEWGRVFGCDAPTDAFVDHNTYGRAIAELHRQLNALRARLGEGMEIEVPNSSTTLPQPTDFTETEKGRTE